MGFAEDIKKIRIKALMTQEEFAKELGVAFTTVNRWETGKSTPGIKAMRVIDGFCKSRGVEFDVTEAKINERFDK